MRLFTDHRVEGNIALPGASHVALMASSAAVGATGGRGGSRRAECSVSGLIFSIPFVLQDSRPSTTAGRGGFEAFACTCADSLTFSPSVSM